MREALDSVLGAADDIEVVAPCSDRDALLAAIEAERPTWWSRDIRMPPTDRDEGLQVAETLCAEASGQGVVLLSQFADPQYGIALLEHGSDGRAYLLKERIQYRGQLVAAIRAVAQGGSMIDPKVVEALIAERHARRVLAACRADRRESSRSCAWSRAATTTRRSPTRSSSRSARSRSTSTKIFRKLGLNAAPDISQRVKATLIYLAETTRS